MKLRNLSEDYQFVSPNWYLGYHVTDSFNIVKQIFKEGFKTFEEITTCGKVCFSDKPWADMGLYVIKLAAQVDEHTKLDPTPSRPWQSVYGGDPEGKGESRLVGTFPQKLRPARAWGHRFPGREIRFGAQAESGAEPENVKPVAWGIAFSIDDILWIKESPEKFDFDKYDDIVKAHATEDWQLKTWEKDKRTEGDAMGAIRQRPYNPKIFAKPESKYYQQKPINI